MRKLILTASALVIFAACVSSRPKQIAMATLQPTTGQTAHGAVHFTENGDGTVDVQVNLTSVPSGIHGFHVHEKGDCGDDGKAAGGHFNPTGMAHGAPDANSHHSGDFGNVTADANGEVHTSFTTRAITVSPGATSVVGHAIVLHGGADDLASQPAGNAGPRIACGVAESMAADMHH
ncbi:MAG: superoxide dismutase family protein [Acidobacteriota bacterium]